jgi:hypothetical protein
MQKLRLRAKEKRLKKRDGDYFGKNDYNSNLRSFYSPLLEISLRRNLHV